MVVGEEGERGRGSGFSHKINKQEAAQQLKQKLNRSASECSVSLKAQPKVERTGARRGMRSGTRPGFTKAVFIHSLSFFLSLFYQIVVIYTLYLLRSPQQGRGGQARTV